jgi:hypothetical protein
MHTFECPIGTITVLPINKNRIVLTTKKTNFIEKDSYNVGFEIEYNRDSGTSHFHPVDEYKAKIWYVDCPRVGTEPDAFLLTLMTEEMQPFVNLWQKQNEEVLDQAQKRAKKNELDLLKRRLKETEAETQKIKAIIDGLEATK